VFRRGSAGEVVLNAYLFPEMAPTIQEKHVRFLAQDAGKPTVFMVPYLNSGSSIRLFTFHRLAVPRSCAEL
jgi:hypothetical protein